MKYRPGIIKRTIQEVNSVYPKVYIDSNRNAFFVGSENDLPEVMDGIILELKEAIDEKEFVLITPSQIDTTYITKLIKLPVNWSTFYGNGFYYDDEFNLETEMALEVFANSDTPGSLFEESPGNLRNVITDTFYDSHSSIGFLHIDDLIISPSFWAINKNTRELEWMYLTEWNNIPVPLEGPSGNAFLPAGNKEYLITYDWLQERTVILKTKTGEVVYEGNLAADFSLPISNTLSYDVTYYNTLEDNVFMFISYNSNISNYSAFLLTIDETVSVVLHPESATIASRKTSFAQYLLNYFGNAFLILDEDYYYFLEPDEIDTSDTFIHKLDANHNIVWSQQLNVTFSNWNNKGLIHNDESIYFIHADNNVVLQELDKSTGTIVDTYTLTTGLVNVDLLFSQVFVDGYCYIILGEGNTQHGFTFSHDTKSFNQVGIVNQDLHHLMSDGTKLLAVDNKGNAITTVATQNDIPKLLRLNSQSFEVFSFGNDYLEFALGWSLPGDVLLESFDSEGNVYLFENNEWVESRLYKSTLDLSHREFRQINSTTLTGNTWYTPESSWNPGYLKGLHQRSSGHHINIFHEGIIYSDSLISGDSPSSKIDLANAVLGGSSIDFTGIGNGGARVITLSGTEVHYMRFFSNGLWRYDFSTEQHTQLIASGPVGSFNGSTNAPVFITKRSNGDVVVISSGSQNTSNNALQLGVVSYDGTSWSILDSGGTQTGFNSHRHGFCYDNASDTLYGINVQNDTTGTLTTVFTYNWVTNGWDVFDQQSVTLPITVNYRERLPHIFYNGVIYTPANVKFNVATQTWSDFMPPMRNHMEYSGFGVLSADLGRGIIYRININGEIFAIPVNGDVAVPY